MTPRLRLPRPRWNFRTRVAVAIMLLLLLFGVGLVTIIEVLSMRFLPQSTMIGVFDARTPRQILLRAIALSPFDQRIQQGALNLVLMVSLIGLLSLSTLGGVAAYFLAGRLLSAVRAMAVVVGQTNAETLDHRVAAVEPGDELGELSHTLNALLERLEGSFAQQRAFVADASHQLRTPLAVLRTNLEVARQDPQQATIVYARLERSLSRLNDLVNDLLLLAQQDQSLCGAPVGLGLLLEDLLTSLADLAAEHTVTLHTQGDAAVSTWGEDALLTHLFGNLVENGIRYNRPGGTVTVTLGVQDGWATVTVSDTGVGIPHEEQELIFRRFYRREQSRAHHTGGNGLGLAIAAHVAQRYGGTITVTSTLGVGSTFTVRLPACDLNLTDGAGLEDD